MLNKNEKAHQYALSNGEEPDTMDFLTTIQDFESGYNESLKEVEFLKEEIKILQKQLAKEESSLLKAAKDLLLKTYKLPQNQTWNTLYSEGETIRNEITKFLYPNQKHNENSNRN